MSFDDGANWESLRLNLPATSVRDLIVKSDDLVVARMVAGFGSSTTLRSLRQFNKSYELCFLNRKQLCAFARI